LFTDSDLDPDGPVELHFRVTLCNPSFTINYDRAGVFGGVHAEPRGCEVSLVGAAIENLRVNAANVDGYLEDYDFEIVIDADAPAGSRCIVAEVGCQATGQGWFSPAFTVNGVGDHDKAVMAFDERDFAPEDRTALEFTVRIWDAACTAPLTPVADVAGGPVLVEPPAWTGSVTVHGTVRYKRKDGTLRPVRYAKVELWEEAVEKTATLTNANGEYTKTFATVRPGDVFIRVRTESAPGAYSECSPSIATVRPFPGGSSYYADSSSSAAKRYLHIDFVISNAGDNAGVFHIFDSVVEGFDRTAAWLGSVPPSEATVLWPADLSCYDLGSERIHLLELDRWDRDVIMHEYGHFIADQFGFLQTPGGEHNWDHDLRDYGIPRSNEEAAQLAFSEAWATFFAVAAQYSATGDTRYDDTEDMSISLDLETDTDKHYAPGEYYESMAACALWDILDDNDDFADDDDTLTLPVADLWTLLCEDMPATMGAFWDDWQNTHAFRTQVWRILRDHEMSLQQCTVRVVSNVSTAGFVLTEQDSRPIIGSAPAVYAEMPPGVYTISWDPIAGKSAPAAMTRAAAAGESITFPGIFADTNNCGPPPQPRIASVSAASISVVPGPDADPCHALFAIKCTATDPPDTYYEHHWIGPCGRPSAEPMWLTAQQWAGAAAGGLRPLTTYWFAARAKTADAEETEIGPAAAAQTSVAGDVTGDCTVNILDMITIRSYVSMDSCSTPGALSADLDGDGNVNILDMIVCRNNLNGVCPYE